MTTQICLPNEAAMAIGEVEVEVVLAQVAHENPRGGGGGGDGGGGRVVEIRGN